MKVTITPKDFANAPNGYTGNDCPLAQALRRQGMNNLRVGALWVWDEGEDSPKYDIPQSWGFFTYSIEEINELSSKAKISLEDIPTVELELIEVN